MKIIKQKWFIGLIVTLLLSLIIWFVGPLVAINESYIFASASVRILIIFAFIIIWGIFNLTLNNKENVKKNQNADESRAETENKSMQLNTVVHGMSDEFTVVQQIEKAYHTHSLPGFLVVGEKQVGKTTMLKNSGINFPLVDTQKILEKQQHSQWWFTQNGVFVEYSLDPNNLQQLHSFSKTLKEYKQRKITGIIFCISVASLMQSESAIKEQALLLKNTINLMNQKFSMDFPVYLTITQCDRLPGFNYFFSEIEDKQQIFGTTLDISKVDITKIVQTFKDKLHLLIDALKAQLFSLLKSEVDIVTRMQIYAFPKQFEVMISRLQLFLVSLYTNDYYLKNIQVQGIYFTSSLQQGNELNPLVEFQTDHALINSSEANNCNKQPPLFIKQFLLDLCQTKLGQAVYNTKKIIINTWRQRIVFICSTIVVIVMLGLWSTSLKNNELIIGDIKNKLLTYKNLTITNVPTMLQSLGLLEQLNKNIVDSNSNWQYGLGLFFGKPLETAIKKLYLNNSGYYLQPIMKDIIEQALKSENNNALYQSLKTYLMLGNKDLFKSIQIQKWLLTDHAKLHRQVFTNLPELKFLLLKFYNQYSQTITTNPNLIQQVRVKLNQVTPAERAYWTLAQESEKQFPNQYLLVNNLDKFNQVFNHQGIKLAMPSIFTIVGLEKIYPKLSTKIIANTMKDDWIIDANKTNIESKLQFKQELQTIYLNNYITQWNTLLQNISIIKFNNFQQAQQVVSLLSSSQSPLLALLQSIAENTSISATTNKTSLKLKTFVNTLQNQAQQKFKQQFANLNQVLNGPQKSYVQIQQALLTLKKSLDKITQASNPNKAAFIAARNRMLNQDETGINNLLLIAKLQPQPIETWLNQVANQSWKLLLQASANYITTTWNNNIQLQFNSQLAPYFPYNRQATNEVNIADFLNFYNKNSQANKLLALILPFINTTEQNWHWQSLNGRTIPLSNALLNKFKKIKYIQQSFINQQGSNIKIKFSIKPINLDSQTLTFKLRYGNKLLTYRHGPEQTFYFQWPLTDENNISINFMTTNNGQITKSYNGTWAFFKLLSKAKIESTMNPSNYLVTLEQNGHYFQFLLHAQQIKNPFAILAKANLLNLS